MLSNLIALIDDAIEMAADFLVEMGWYISERIQDLFRYIKPEN